jgi:hypothetical protein
VVGHDDDGLSIYPAAERNGVSENARPTPANMPVNISFRFDGSGLGGVPLFVIRL